MNSIISMDFGHKIWVWFLCALAKRHRASFSTLVDFILNQTFEHVYKKVNNNELKIILHDGAEHKFVCYLFAFLFVVVIIFHNDRNM